MSSSMKHVVIVGGGLAGIAAALEVERFGCQATLIEAEPVLGGRLKSDFFAGFILDHGFQVLLSSYPALQRLGVLDLMDLRFFQSGACCRISDQWLSLYHPFCHPIEAWSSLFRMPGVFFLDFFKLGSVLLSKSDPKESTQQLLERLNFSNLFVERFLRPFFGGVFLENKLETLSHLFRVYLKFFTKGRAGLPQKGMQQLPRELEKKLKNTKVLCNRLVTAVNGTQVSLSDGSTIQGDGLVLALSEPALNQLLGKQSEQKSRSVICFYYTAPKGVFSPDPILYLGQGGAINNLCFPNRIQPSYAPKESDLLSITVLDESWLQSDDLQKEVESELNKWFGVDMKKVVFLKKYRIDHALPTQNNFPQSYHDYTLNQLKNVFIGGELTDYASINGALSSGMMAGRAACESILF